MTRHIFIQIFLVAWRFKQSGQPECLSPRLQVELGRATLQILCETEICINQGSGRLRPRLRCE